MASRKSTTTVRRDVAAEVTATFIAQIEQAIAEGKAPAWRHPWVAGGRPVSMSTRKTYRGINVFLLSISQQAQQFTSPWWGTYNQIAEKAGMVKVGSRWVSPDGTPRGVRAGNCDGTCKTGQSHYNACGGNHGTVVVLYKTWEKTERDPNTGETTTQRIPTMRSFVVFNADQADGLPERYQPKAGAVVEMPEPQAVLDDYLASDGAPDFYQDVIGEAYFIPSQNEVHVPPMAGHRTPDLYWSTTFHECGHAADFALRRQAEEAQHGRSKSTYAFGELVAEMTAGILCAETGVDCDGDNSVTYLRGWLRKLADDPKMLPKAAAAAQRAADKILGQGVVSEVEEEEAEPIAA
jgi:antirestriction protein ArdC